MGSFADRRKQAEKEGLLGKGDYLKLKDGANRLRLVSDCLPHPGTYQGKPNFKWLCYVLDRADGKIKPMFMAHVIYKQIEALQGSEDYSFDDPPMPYDITVNADGAGTKEVKYTVMPARKNTPLTQAEEAELSVVKPLKDLQAALKKEKGNPSEDHDPHGPLADDEEPPF